MSLPSEQPPQTDTASPAADEPVVLDGKSASSDEETTSLPVPSGPLRSHLSESTGQAKRPSFWKRFKMRSRASTKADAGTSSDVTARLEAIEQAVEHFDTTLEAQLEAINARLEDVWESEEQLSHLTEIQDKLDRLAATQAQQAKAIGAFRRTQGWLAALVVVAAISIGYAASQLL